MRKSLLAAVYFIGSVGAVRAQTFTITLNAGVLRGANGVGGEPAGGLLQLIASPSGTFSAPTSSSYVSGDNVVVESFAMNDNGGNGFTVNTLNSIAFTTANYTLTTGESLLLRFYPSLTLTGMPSAPTLATTYGQVRSSTVEFGGTTDPTETPWIVPAASANRDFDYVTTGTGVNGATYADDTAYASDVVFAATVPEPSAYATLGCGLICLASLYKRVRGLVSRT